MGLHLTLRGDSGELIEKLSTTELDVLQYISAQSGMKSTVDTICSPTEFGVPRNVNTLELLAALRALIAWLDCQSQSFPVQYGLKYSTLEGMTGTGSGMSGIQIGGKYHNFNCGLELLDIEIYELDGDGNVQNSSIRDGRNESEFIADNGWRIKVTRRKKPVALKSFLVRLTEYVARQNSETIEQTLG